MSKEKTSFLEGISSLFGSGHPEKWVVEAAVCSDVGERRGNNEDNFVFCDCWNENSEDEIRFQNRIVLRGDQWTLFGVFDGMGGGEGGEIASRLTAERMLDIWESWEDGTEAPKVCADIRAAFLRANNEIVGMRQNMGIYGTTGTLLVTNGTYARIFHLGDSRLYQYRNRELRQMTTDQTLANMKINAGFYQPDDPLVEKEKHYLTEFIGCDQTMQGLRPIESEWFALDDGDTYLICSDGLYDMVSDTVIRDWLADDLSAKQTARGLVEEANKNGGLDNVTCMILKF